MSVEILLNCAASLDGRLARADGSQTRLSNLADRCRVQSLRAKADAIVVGSGTVKADDPHLTVKPRLALRWRELAVQDPSLEEWGREPRPAWHEVLDDPEAFSSLETLSLELADVRPDKLSPTQTEQAEKLWELNPLRVVLDGQGMTMREAAVVDARARTLIFTNQLGSVQLWGRFSGWPNVEVVLMDRVGEQEGVDLESSCRYLVSRGLEQVLVEGGSRIFGSLLSSGKYDMFEIFYRPFILGHLGVPLSHRLFPGGTDEAALRLAAFTPLPALEEKDWDGHLVRYVPE